MRVKWLTDVHENLAPGRTVYAGTSGVPHRVATLHDTPRPRMRLELIDTREAAERLGGDFLWVPLREAVALPAGRYYVCEIIGVEVQSMDGESFGQVREVIHTGSNDVYVARGPRGETLIPAIPDVVKEFDAVAGVMRVRMIPDGP